LAARPAPARLSHDALQRIGYVAGIYKALQIVYSDAQQADSRAQRTQPRLWRPTAAAPHGSRRHHRSSRSARLSRRRASAVELSRSDEAHRLAASVADHRLALSTD
jgi:hypothetical protein